MSSFNPLSLTEQQQQIQKTIELSQNAKLKYPLNFFRSPIDIIDIWSDLNFTEFESIKNGYQSFNIPAQNNIQQDDMQLKQPYLKTKFSPFLKLEDADPNKINENVIFSVTNGENQNQSSSFSLEEQSYQYLADNSLEQQIDAKKAKQQKYHLFSLSPHIVFNPRFCLKKIQEYQAVQFMQLFFASNKDNEYPSYKTVDNEWGSAESFSPLPQYKRQLLFFTKMYHDLSQNQITKISQSNENLRYPKLLQNVKEEQSKFNLKIFLLEIIQILNKKKSRVPFIICLRSLENDYLEKVTKSIINLLNSIMISSVIKNSLLKTSFKFMSFQRNLVSTKMNSRSYIFSLKISTSIKAIKQQKEFQIEIKVDPEIPFDIKFDNIIVKDSLEPPSESHITQHFKVLKENKFETWVLQLIELFLQDTLEGIHERTQMMYTDDTQYYKHEIQKQMNIDDSDLKKTPELDNVVKEKYFPQISILTLPQSRPIPQYANMRNQNQMRNYQMMAGQNQIQHSRSPNPSNQRNQSGNPYENIPQQQQQNRPYLPHQMINNNQIDANQLRQQQINPQIRQMQRPQFYQQHMLLNPTLNPPVVNQQIPRQNSQQPHPQNQPLMPPVQDIRIRQTSQSGSINQIPPQQNSNPNLVVAPRPPHQQAPQPDAMIQPHGAQIPLQSGIPPHIQKKELQQNHNIAHSQVQQPSLIQQNSNQNHPNIQPHMQNPQYNQYISGNLQQQQQLPGVPPSGQIQQQQMNQHQTQNIPLQQPNMQVGGIQPQINNPAQNVQQQPAQFDPNLGPNNFQQHQPPPGIMARSNHPIAPQNY